MLIRSAFLRMQGKDNLIPGLRRLITRVRGTTEPRPDERANLESRAASNKNSYRTLQSVSKESTALPEFGSWQFPKVAAQNANNARAKN